MIDIFSGLNALGYLATAAANYTLGKHRQKREQKKDEHEQDLASQQNWQAERVQVIARQNEAEKRQLELTTMVGDLQISTARQIADGQRRSARRERKLAGQIAALQVELESYRAKVARLQDELADVVAANEQLQAELATAQAHIDDLTKALQALGHTPPEPPRRRRKPKGEDTK